MRVQVIGCGVVGSAVADAAEDRGHHVSRFDPAKSLHDFDGAADLALVCVGTPPREDGGCDVAAVQEAVRRLHNGYFGGICAIRSTVPPTLCDQLASEKALSSHMLLCSWPEFLRAATAQEQAAQPAYHVWGVKPHHRERILPILHEFIAGGAEAPILVTTPVEAELLKYGSNAILAAQVIVANQLYEVAEECGADWNALARQYPQVEPLVGGNLHVTDERGFGGGCLPKDLAALRVWAEKRGVNVDFLKAIEGFNIFVRGQSECD